MLIGVLCAALVGAQALCKTGDSCASCFCNPDTSQCDSNNTCQVDRRA